MNVLPDALAPGLDIVFCGTAASTASARKRAYYAGPGNAFWATLYRTGLTPRRLQPEEFRSITEFGLGLTDLAKTTSGQDRTLRSSHFDRNGLRNKILHYHPRMVAFTSKRAAGEFLGRQVAYGFQEERVGKTKLFVLCSPSGAARRYWDDRIWLELANCRFGQ